MTVRALRPLISGLMALGYEAGAFLATQGVDRQHLQDPDATVPMRVCVDLLAEGVRATGDDNLGLHVAQRAELGSFDVHFYAMGPFSEFNMLAGLTLLKLRHFTIGTLIGCAPKALAWSGLGALLF